MKCGKYMLMKYYPNISIRVEVPVYGTRNYQSNHFRKWNENIQENLFFEIESNENLNGQSAHFRN